MRRPLILFLCGAIGAVAGIGKGQKKDEAMRRLGDDARGSSLGDRGAGRYSFINPDPQRYDQSFYKFGRARAHKESDDEGLVYGETAAPDQWINRERMEVVGTKMISTLEDMGVAVRPEDPNPLQSEPGQSVLSLGESESESFGYARTGDDLRRSKPMSQQEAYDSEARRRGFPSMPHGNLRGGSTQRAVKARNRITRAAAQLKVASGVSKFALATDDPDAAAVFAGAYATGENLEPAIRRITSKSGDSAIRSDDSVERMVNEILGSGNVEAKERKNDGAKERGSERGTERQSVEVNDKGEGKICPFCETVEIGLGGVIGPKARLGPRVPVPKDANKGSVISLGDFHGIR